MVNVPGLCTIPLVLSPLGSYEIGKTLKREWNYVSAVGIILYFSENYRSLMSLYVHQCTIFTHNTRASQEESVLRICRYMKITKNNGLIFCTNKEINVDFYVNDENSQYIVLYEVNNKLCHNNFRMTSNLGFQIYHY